MVFDFVFRGYFWGMENQRPQNTLKTERILTPDGKPVATIRSDSKSGVRSGYDNLGSYKGKFDPRKNITYDNKGRPVSRGNSLPAVIVDCICHKGVGSVCHPVAVIQSSYRPVSRPIPAVPSSNYPRGPWRRW